MVTIYQKTKRDGIKDEVDPDDDDNVDAQANIRRFAQFYKRKLSQKDKEVEKKQEDYIKILIDAKEVIKAGDVQGIGAELFQCQNSNCSNQVCPTQCKKPPCDCKPDTEKDPEDKRDGDVCKFTDEKLKHCDKACRNGHKDCDEYCQENRHEKVIALDPLICEYCTAIFCTGCYRDF